MLASDGIHVLRWSVLAVTIIVSGFAGVVLGAWLMTRTEQWNLEREHYSRVLRSLADLRALIGKLQKGESKIGKGHIALLEISSRITSGQRRAARWCCAVVLSEDAAEVLEDLEAQWRKVKGTGDGDLLVAEGFRVVSDSYKRLLVASRSDLGLKKTSHKVAAGGTTSLVMPGAAASPPIGAVRARGLGAPSPAGGRLEKPGPRGRRAEGFVGELGRPARALDAVEAVEHDLAQDGSELEAVT